MYSELCLAQSKQFYQLLLFFIFIIYKKKCNSLLKILRNREKKMMKTMSIPKIQGYPLSIFWCITNLLILDICTDIFNFCKIKKVPYFIIFVLFSFTKYYEYVLLFLVFFKNMILMGILYATT